MKTCKTCGHHKANGGSYEWETCALLSSRYGPPPSHPLIQIDLTDENVGFNDSTVILDIRTHEDFSCAGWTE